MFLMRGYYLLTCVELRLALAKPLGIFGIDEEDDAWVPVSVIPAAIALSAPPAFTTSA